MLPRRLSATLRRLYARDVRVDEAARDALEHDLLERFGRRRVDAPSTPTWWWALRRVAVVATVLVAIVGACRVPVEYPLEIGERLAVLLPADQRDIVDVEAIAGYIEESFAPDELMVNVRLEQRLATGSIEDPSAGTMRIQFEWVGQVDADEVWAAVAQQFPAVAHARIEANALEGVVEGTLGGFLSHEMLDVVIDRQGVEAAKALILERLAEQGLHDNARVDVHVDRSPDGEMVRARVEVSVSDTSGETSEAPQ